MITVITPTHDTRWLEATLGSLNAQTLSDWEWLVVPNLDVSPGDLPASVGESAKVIEYDGEQTIGAIKRFCCERASGDIIVELDHDDLLTPRALQRVDETFLECHDVDFVYSNFAEFHDETWKPHTYDPSYGWMTRPARFYSHDFREIRAFEPDARTMSLVHYAPNHVRAWRKSAYLDIGGHDESMTVCDDHDLVCRFYLSKRMKHIDECLYLYRLHGDNSYLVRNAQIQRQTQDVRRKYLHPMAIRWADLNGLPKVDLGAAHGKPAGFIGVDMEAAPGVDKVCDVTAGLPFDDSSVGVVRAMDFLEHIPDSVALMNEIHRVLVDGGWLLSGTPSSDGRGAFQDPTHVSFWNENSFWYYTNRPYANYVSGIACRFQAVRVETYFPSDFHRKHDIPYVYADLCAVKSDERRPGQVLM